jgi:predicted nucleotidyltransferase
MTDKTPADDPILKRFRAALSELYGDRAERVVLFGSRTRGDAYEDSGWLTLARKSSSTRTARSSTRCRFAPVPTMNPPR